MIELTRLNGHKLSVNCDLIRYAEASPDTVLTLITGEKLIVLETCDELNRLIFNQRADLLRAAWPDAAIALAAASALHINQPAHTPPTDPGPFFDRD